MGIDNQLINKTHPLPIRIFVPFSDFFLHTIGLTLWIITMGLV